VPVPLNVALIPVAVCISKGELGVGVFIPTFVLK